MKHSFSSVLVLAILFHLPCLVYGAPFTWRNRHAYYARSVEANSTTTLAAEATATTTLAKGEEATTTAFVNSTTIAEEKATATKTQAESTASTTIIHGKSPLQTALLPRITDWNSCQGFLSNSGINLFVNQIDLNFDVVINQVTVFEILIDNKGRARETRVRHAFPQPTNYYAEFDNSKNKPGNNKPGNNKGNKGNKGKATVTAIASHVTETAGKAKETTTTTTTAGKAEETAATATESANTAEETATATESANKAEETASATTTTASAGETTTAAEAAESTTSSKETAAAEATALY